MPSATVIHKVLNDTRVRLVVLGSLFFAALVSRRPELLLNPQFWAEDGMIFYQQAHEQGFLRTLAIPHSGYLHTLPRLIAGVAQLIPLARAPLLFNLIGLFVQSLPATYLCSSRMRNIGTLPVRILLAVLYLGVPNVWRVHGSLTNAQWHLAVLGCLILIASAPKSTWAAVFDVAALAITCVTGPFVLFLLPAGVVIAWQRRDAWAIRRVLILAVGVVGVAIVIWVWTRMAPTGNLAASVPAFFRILTFQIFIPVFWGINPSAEIAQYPLLFSFVSYAVTATGLALMAYVFVRGSTEVRCFLLFAVLQLGASLASPLASWTEPQWIALQQPGATHRYWMLPEVAVAVAVVAFTCGATQRLARAAGAALIAVILVVDVVHWRMPELPDLQFRRWAAAFESARVGTQMRIPILPLRWSFVITKTERD